MESVPPKPSEEPEGAPPPPEDEPAAPTASAPAPAGGEPSPDAPAEAGPGTAGDETDAAAPAHRPRGRTSLIIASAALLGVVAGVATGYTVQADREPTPLPPLSQAKLSYPEKYVPEDEWEPIPAKHDRRVKTDGDLRKLLLDKPKGAREALFGTSPDGWIPLTSYAAEFEASAHMLQEFTEGDIRRVAGTAWDSGQYRMTTVRLVQFHDLVHRSALTHAAGQQLYMPGDQYAASDGRPFGGPDNGLYWVDEAPQEKAGYLPTYRNRAVAWRGDIMLDIFIQDVRPISAKDIRELAERQLERL